MKLEYETPSLEEVMILTNVITESVPGTLIPGDEIEGGETIEW